jgi:hypothetical protein
MAYTLPVLPDKFSPAYNPIYFYTLNTTNYTFEGYKYIVDVYSGDTLSNRIGRYKLFPRPVDGYGIADINQLLSNQVSYYINQNLYTIADAKPDYIRYNVSFGEEYTYFWNFDDNQAVLSGPFTGNLQFVNFAGAVPAYVAGDYVLVDQDPGFTEPNYNGIFLVLTAYTGTVVVDYTFTTVTPVNPGTIYFNDKRKVERLDLLRQTGYTAFNGAIPHQEFLDYTSNTYLMSPVKVPGEFLTNVPQNYRLKPTNSMWLNFYTNDYANTTYCLLNTRYGQYAFQNFLSGTPGVQIFAVGPGLVDISAQTLNQIGAFTWSNEQGTYPIIKNKCWCYDQVVQNGIYTNLINSSGEVSPWYNDYNDQIVDINYGGSGNYSQQATLINTLTGNSVTVNIGFASLSGTPSGCIRQLTEAFDIQWFDPTGLLVSSEKKNFLIDWNTTRYGNVELVFIDRLGSLIPANFELQKSVTINISRSEYQTLLGDRIGSTNKWGYESTERGRNTLNTQTVKQIDLISNWITEEESEYLKELYTSPVVYIKENGKLWPVIIKTNSYKVVSKKNKKNIQIQISIEMANNDRVQNF